MGYSTEFKGEFVVDRPLTEAHRGYLKAFSESRRMKRDAAGAEKHSDPLRMAVGLPIGIEGGFFVGGLLLDDKHECAGQHRSADVLEYNEPPEGQPGLWCKWAPDDEGTTIQWNGYEKFYDYTAWLVYLIENFLKPWGYVLNGEVDWQGDNDSDVGTIFVKDNLVEAIPGVKTFTTPRPSWERASGVAPVVQAAPIAPAAAVRTLADMVVDALAGDEG